ncbi:MAG: zf-HC2 domain-containing protein [candidate division WOR-3 bacterium]
MSCESIKELISAYIDAELERIDITKVENHIKKCDECNKLLHSYQSIRYSIRSIEIPKPSDEILKRIVRFPRRNLYRLRKVALSFSFLSLLAISLLPFLKNEERYISEEVREEYKNYYIIREEKNPYVEVYYEKEGNFLLTNYSGGSF